MVFISDDIRAKAIIVYGDEVCRERSRFLVSEVGFPPDILPVRDVIECGYVEETGFVWMKMKNKVHHSFAKVGKPAVMATEVTAYVEKYKVKKLTGVKAKELMMWFSLTDIYMEDPKSRMITFKSSTGLSRVYHASLFEDDIPKKIEEEKIEEKNDAKLPVKESLLVKE